MNAASHTTFAVAGPDGHVTGVGALVNRMIDRIFDLFARFGADGYGEDLSLAQHMLQSAALAQALGAGEGEIIAALLHDIGYFLHAEATGHADPGQDFAHESLGAVWLSQAFDEAVTSPIALHVEAKRYLCATQPGYFERLSGASQLSLSQQGGVMSPAEANAFAQRPGFEAALLLRRCDDQAKDAALPVQSIEAYRERLIALLRPSGVTRIETAIHPGADY